MMLKYLYILGREMRMNLQKFWKFMDVCFNLQLLIKKDIRMYKQQSKG
jgi:hypothetical protein